MTEEYGEVYADDFDYPATAKDLIQRIKRVTKMHRPSNIKQVDPMGSGGKVNLEVCHHCSWEYPCPTVEALEVNNG